MFPVGIELGRRLVELRSCDPWDSKNFLCSLMYIYCWLHGIESRNLLPSFYVICPLHSLRLSTLSDSGPAFIPSLVVLVLRVWPYVFKMVSSYA
jgi:hypothetical protein